MGGKWKHRLSNIDEEGMTAECANCGVVKISFKDGRWKCYVARNQYRRGVYAISADKRAMGYPTTQEREVGIAAQGGKCLICREALEVKDSHWDHCHEKSIFRGYLCSGCNLGLGHFKDNVDHLRNAIEYLQK